MKSVYDLLQGTVGRVDNAYKLMAYHASSLAPFLAWQESLASGPVDERLLRLACVQASLLNGSRYCAMHFTEQGVRAGVSREKFAALPTYQSSRLFSELECLVIRYATEVTRRVHVDAAVVADLELRLGGEGLVQLTLAISAANLLNRFNLALGTQLEPEPVKRRTGNMYAASP